MDRVGKAKPKPSESSPPSISSSTASGSELDGGAESSRRSPVEEIEKGWDGSITEQTIGRPARSPTGLSTSSRPQEMIRSTNPSIGRVGSGDNPRDGLVSVSRLSGPCSEIAIPSVKVSMPRFQGFHAHRMADLLFFGCFGRPATFIKRSVNQYVSMAVSFSERGLFSHAVFICVREVAPVIVVNRIGFRFGSRRSRDRVFLQGWPGCSGRIYDRGMLFDEWLSDCRRTTSDSSLSREQPVRGCFPPSKRHVESFPLAYQKELSS